MPESIVVVRLTRNLRYKLTYIKIFEAYLEDDPEEEIAELLQSLIEAQQTAVGPVSGYLRRVDADVQEIELDERLMSHALGREKLHSRLRFVCEGLRRATAWYKTQLMDRQMTSDPEVQSLLFELGEIDAAKLWHTEAVMAMLRIPAEAKEKDWDHQQRVMPDAKDNWKPRLVEDVARPVWKGSHSPEWPRPSKYRRGGS
jgi:Arc/MetJ family transcription regulator